MTLKERYAQVIDYFKKTNPDATTELVYADNYQLLVAVMLSGQCTDKRINMITPSLFRAYPTPEALAQATEEEVLEYIKSVSYPNSKSRHLVQMARKLCHDFCGVIPDTMEGLTSLPGVGRKTANVMLNVAFGQPAMPVDTHVFRVSARLGLTPQCKTPEQTEEELVRHIAKEDLSKAHHWLILFGRYTCTAQRPKCAECGLSALCVREGIEQDRLLKSPRRKATRKMPDSQ